MAAPSFGESLVQRTIRAPSLLTGVTHQPSKACEFLLKERVVLRAFLLAFQPPHVALDPRVVAFCCKARECLRANVVHHSFLGTLPKYTPLPGLGLLMAMLTLCQIPKRSAGFGI